MSQSDFRQRFVFDQIDARGCVVRLNDTLEAIQTTHHYPANLARVVNQFALAATLLRDSIKIDGSLTIQLRSPGAISLVMADCMADRRVRAIAEFDTEALAASDPIHLDQMGHGAVLSITVTPESGERYQSIVPIENATLALCLEDYFARSEQLPSLFKLHTDDTTALGIAIHALPPQSDTEARPTRDDFERLKLLLDTLTDDEALTLNAQEVLTRLFHDESCRLHDSHTVEFGCLCSAQKSLDAIKALGEEDVDALISEQRAEGNESLVVDCHFCFQRYQFEFNQLTNLFDT